MERVKPFSEPSKPARSRVSGASAGTRAQPNVACSMLRGILGEINACVPCVAGGNAMPLIEAAYAIGLRLVPTRSELGAGFAGNGIAWESGRPALCIVIASVGVYGLVQALHAACVNRRPLVVVSGDVASIGRGSVQAGDGWDGPSVTRVTRPLTAWSFDALTADLAVRGLRRAVLLAREARCPTHLNVPLSVQEQPAP
ncbi:MAG TPA: thiamine pyrophosphate-binding protein [Polyangiaceae bacterium]